MSDLPPSSTNSYHSFAVDQFIATLGELGLVGEEIADVIWLALKIQSYEQPLLSREDDSNKPERKIGDKQRPLDSIDSHERIGSASLPDPSPPQSPPDPSQEKVEVFASEDQPDDKSGNGSRDLAIRLRDARSLQEPLTLARALRPLFLRVSSATMVLDEEATIERITEEKLWDPVLKPDLEPWLDLALVVDESKSMLLWRRTIEELQRILERYGIFRDVRTWGMVIEEGADGNGSSQVQVRIRPGIGKAARNQRTRSPAELIDPQNRRLVLIATDCVASHWHDGTVLSALKIWAGSSSTAIIQMLPEWLWSRTALDLAAPVRFRALLPGIPSQRLQAKALSSWDEIDFATGIQVPIVTLEPEVFTVWSQMVAGKGGVWAPGFVFEPELFEPDEEQKDTADDALSPEQRVKRFRNSASAMAWKLACLLAAAPVINLPVVRIVQYKKLPRSRQVHVAEVFLGGLLRPFPPLSELTPDTNPDSIQYIFADGVQEILLESSRRNESVDVFQVVSNYITGHENTTLEEFVAYLRAPNLLQDGELQSRPIAQVSAKLLKQFGGEFVHHAEQLENSIDDSFVDQPSADEEFSESDEPLKQEKTEILLALEQEALLWQQGKSIEQRFIQHQSQVNCVTFSTDGQLIASADHTGKIYISNLTGDLVTSFDEGQNKVWSITFSNDTSLLISGFDNTNVHLWNIKTNEIAHTWQTESSAYSVAYHPNLDVISSVGQSRKVFLHSINDGSTSVIGSHQGSINSVVFSPNGKLLASCGDDNIVKIWNWETKELIKTLEGHTSWINAIAFHPAGNLIASASSDRTIRLWSISGEPVGTPYQGHTDEVSSITFHPSGMLIASGSRDGTVRLWNLQGEALSEPFIAHSPHVKSVAFSPDGRILASSGSDGVVKFWRNREPEIKTVHRKVLNVPYFSQLSNQKNPLGSSSITALSMVLNYYGVQAQQNGTLADEFYQWLENHGEDQNDPIALEKLYRVYGFNGEFSKEHTWQEITAEIDAERPVIVFGKFSEFGFSVCIIGYDDAGYIVHDPAGTYSQDGYDQRENEGRAVHYSYKSIDRLCNLDDEIWSHFVSPKTITLTLIKKVVLDEISSEQLPAQAHSQYLAALQAIRTTLQRNTWIELATDEQPDYRVKVNTSGEYVICDPLGIPIDNIRPVIKINDRNAPFTIVNRLIHLAKYQAVESLSNSNVNLSQALDVELLMEDETPFHDPQNPIVEDGEIVKLRLSNQGSQSLKVAVLDLDPTWEISQIPIGGLEAPFFVLNAGAVEEIQLRMSVSDDVAYEQTKEILKVFAVQKGLIDFRWLTLPPLDVPLGKRGVGFEEDFKAWSTRSTIREKEPEEFASLNEILKRVGDDEASNSQSSQIVIDAIQEWVSKQIQIVVTRGKSHATTMPVLDKPSGADTEGQSLEAELRAVLANTDQQERTEALARLMERSPETSSNLLDRVSIIQNDAERVSFLVILIPHLPQALLSNALQIVRTIQNTLNRFQGLALLATRLPEVVPEALQASLEVEDESIRMETLATLVGEMPSELLPHALEAALTVDDAFSRVRALSALINRLPDATEMALQAVLEIESEHSRVHALGEIVPRLPNDLLPRALEAAQSIQNKSNRFTALLMLVNRLPEVIPIALEVVRSIQSEPDRAEAISRLVPQLPRSLLPHALELARSIKEKYYRANALTSLASYLPEVLPEVLAIAQKVEDDLARFRIIAALADKLPEVLPEALKSAQAISYEDYRATALVELVENLTLNLMPQFLESLQTIESDHVYAQVIDSLVDKLSPELLIKLRDVSQTMTNEKNRSRILAVLAEKLPSIESASDFVEAIEAVRVEESNLSADSRQQRQNVFDNYYEQAIKNSPKEGRLQNQKLFTNQHLSSRKIKAQQLKAALKELGCYTGEIDNEIDEALIDAVTLFQEQQGIEPPDGICGPVTLSKISEALIDRQGIWRE